MEKPEAEEVEGAEFEAGEAGDPGDPATDAGDDEASAARAVEEELEGETAVADQLLGELEELRDRHLRLAAEFDNYRKRTRQELLKTRELGRADLAGRLLEALDDLRRIAEPPGEAASVEALLEGVSLVERKLLKELGDAGLEPIDAEGKRFDPNEHEALSSVPTADPEEDQVVADVFVPGYRFGDRLLRPARVAVKTYQPDAAGSDSSAADGPAGDERPDGGQGPVDDERPDHA